MSGPAIGRLGHVGIHCRDLQKQKAFYRDVLGLTVTDESDERGLVFLSARPDEEHHELLLCAGRNVDGEAKLLQQVSFRCENVEDVVGFYHRLKDRQVRFDRVITHGNAIGVYFFDPEGNRCEIYWPSGMPARQPFGLDIDLEQPIAEIKAAVAEAVRLYGKTGVSKATGSNTPGARAAAPAS